MPERSTANQDGAQNCGVINPYALAELIAGRKINWKEEPQPAQLLEDILQTPYQELFDPKYGGPLYTGLRLDKNNNLVREHSPLLDVEVKKFANDTERPLSADLTGITNLKELVDIISRRSDSLVAIHCITLKASATLQITLRLPDQLRVEQLARVFPRALITTIAYDPVAGNAPDWNPPYGTWQDPGGHFFNEGAEYFDPIQGAVANCYYIAALSAVSWSMPYRIQEMTRATGSMQQQFTNNVRFYQPDSGGVLDKEIEVSDSVPLTSSGGFIYARSSESGELWPAIYEKAFAKYKTPTLGDHPDIPATGWGDCVYATALLTGGTRHYFNNAGQTGDDVWNLVRSHSMSKRTFHPMTCWTYSTGDATQNHLDYSNAHVVASHCYTILGWDYYCGRKYIILRNPWGNTEATLNVENRTVALYDISWWRSINLSDVDGVFAMEAGTFQQYYAGVGVVV